MAQLSIPEANHKYIEWHVSGLAYPLNTYSKFVFHVYQTIDGEYLELIELTLYTSGWATDEHYGFYYSYDNMEYLGDNILSPGCSYVTTVTCYHGNTPYTLNDCTFNTRNITPINQTFTPSVYAPIRRQNGSTCVANACAGAMDTFKLKTTGDEAYRYSSAYIFGSDGRSDYTDGMYFKEAVQLCTQHGSPRYEIAEGFLGDTFFPELTKENSILLFQNANEAVKTNAKRQCFGNYENIDFYDCQSIHNCLNSGGCFAFNFRIPLNFYQKVDDSGIVPQPADGYTGINHSMIIIGSTIKNNKFYWIAQNSWGDSWGDSGLCYIPYDWGSGVRPPVSNTEYNLTSSDNIMSGDQYEPIDPTLSARSGSWTMDCYAIYPGSGYTNNNPAAPYNIKYRQVGRERKAHLTYDFDGDADKYIILAAYGPNNPPFYVKCITADDTCEISFDEYKFYYVHIMSMKDGYCSKLSNYLWVQLFERPLPPRDWSWSNIQPGVAVIDIPYNWWRSFYYRIQDWLRYKCMDYDDPGTTKYGKANTLDILLAKMNELGTNRNKLTANKFNIAKYVIEKMGPTKPVSFTDRSPGDKVYAYYFHELADALNSIPE